MDDAAAQAHQCSLWQFAQRAPDHAILLLDADGIVCWANATAARIFGAAPDLLVGCTLERFFTPEDVRVGIPRQEIAVAIERGFAEDNRWMARVDRSRFWASGSLTVLKDDAGTPTGFVKILRNLTEWEMQVETLRNRVAALTADDESKNLAIATITHELRNPLSALGMAQAVLRKLTGEDVRLKPMLDVLERNVGFTARLVEDMESAIRAGTGRLKLQVEVLRLDEILHAASQAAVYRSGNPDRHIEQLLPPGEPICFQADRLRIQQVFTNLIGNAIKFTPTGRIWIAATVQGAWLVVRIDDTGIGIAPEMLEEIFGMFTQVQTPLSHAGLGIGLALVKNIVELHGGSVQAHSDGIGKGSTFTVRLPLHATGVAPLPSDAAQRTP